MKNLKHLLAIVFAVAIILPFASCLDDENTTPYIKKLPTSIKRSEWFPVSLYGTVLETRFTYDAQNRIIEYTEILNSPEGDLTYKSVIEYTDTDNIVAVKRYLNGELNRLTDFEYSGNKITSTQSYYSDGSVYYVSTPDILKINSKKQLVESSAADRHYVEKYMYDNDGNLTIIKYYNGFELKQKYEIIYDNKNGLLSVINTPAWLLMYMSKEFLNGYHFGSNAVTIKRTIYENNVAVIDGEIYNTVAHHYKYDSDNYPIVIPIYCHAVYQVFHTITYKVVD